MTPENVDDFEPLPDAVFDPNCEVFILLGLPWCWPF